MGEWHDVTIIKTKPSGFDSEIVTIEITDNRSRIQFLEVRMSLEEFGRMMASPTTASAKVQLRGVD